MIFKSFLFSFFVHCIATPVLFSLGRTRKKSLWLCSETSLLTYKVMSDTQDVVFVSSLQELNWIHARGPWAILLQVPGLESIFLSHFVRWDPQHVPSSTEEITKSGVVIHLVFKWILKNFINWTPFKSKERKWFRIFIFYFFLTFTNSSFFH